ncbi:4'-phosphopantetheinyl transferase family protein [Pseudidiomarina insulisalsae]|uniref:4'-phosphopantetheinyl transferase N-terminal domain-containing protein n=1 Tax=Pseudidiomarina insulisalsae TaxID=575789 RepID=A0A432YQ48_9GAMM|nr:hypothetical protein [Pseudidiomarina insulisalsae]RUO63513.1 hypothetical protein CWI71_00135 [Pseudidiomarina insulisalsae]
MALRQLARALANWNSAAEVTRAQTYQSESRQQQHLAGRGLLRKLVCEVTGAAKEDVHITRQQNGAPQLRIGNEQLACSISHKADAVLVAFGQAEQLGVDIEAIAVRKRHDDLISQFSEGFMDGVEVSDLTTFYQRWTLAEAVTKARQGKLLATLKEAFAGYQSAAVFHQEADFMMCCYALRSAQRVAQVRPFQWYRLEPDNGGMLAAQHHAQ